MRKQWRDIPGFEDYAISPEGEVLNNYTHKILGTRPNKEGVWMVSLSRDKQHYTRSVAKLVAEIYLDPHPYPPFNTPTHMDGDKSNFRADNLAWRPRWFAVKYHRQFKYPNPYIRARNYIRCVETGELFNDPMDAAKACGLLASDIALDIINQKGVFPSGYHFVTDKEKG